MSLTSSSIWLYSQSLGWPGCLGSSPFSLGQGGHGTSLLSWTAYWDLWYSSPSCSQRRLVNSTYHCFMSEQQRVQHSQHKRLNWKGLSNRFVQVTTARATVLIIRWLLKLTVMATLKLCNFKCHLTISWNCLISMYEHFAMSSLLDVIIITRVYTPAKQILLALCGNFEL